MVEFIPLAARLSDLVPDRRLTARERIEKASSRALTLYKIE